ncbi:hypothetical protein OQA88_8330 [Cercophora sp. LCS_1]
MSDNNKPPSRDQSYQQNGAFTRPASTFRSFITPSPSSPFPAAAGRYALYLAPTCPWAHRTLIVRHLKGLDTLIDLYPLHPHMGPEGWYFSGESGSLPVDPLYGFTHLKQLYHKAEPSFSGRYTVPVLWDKQTHTIVNNESSEIIRMFGTAFDDLLPQHLRETNRPGGGLYPPPLRPQINQLNEWIYDKINNGVYKTGFATTQEAYEANLYPLFQALDRVEEILSDGRRYLLGESLTEADVRLYTTIARFDVGYVPVFLCNLKTVRHDYPRIYLWFRRLYWDREGEETRGAFWETTSPWIGEYGLGYARARHKIVFDLRGPLIVPRGPQVLVDPLPEE